MRALINRAALEHRIDGVIAADTLQDIAAEGWELRRIERQVERINAAANTYA